MSFRTKEYYTSDEDWDETGIDVAFFSGHQKIDLIIRFIIIVLAVIDLYTLTISILTKITIFRIFFFLLIVCLLLILIPFRPNLKVLHLELKRMDVYTYKKYPFLKPILLHDESVFLKDFKSASLSKVNLRLSPYWKITLKFLDPDTTIVIPFREDLPYKIHHAVYYGLNKRASADVKKSITAMQKFYPYFELKENFEHVEFRYLLLLSLFLGYIIFTLVLPIIIS